MIVNPFIITIYLEGERGRERKREREERE